VIVVKKNDKDKLVLYIYQHLFVLHILSSFLSKMYSHYEQRQNRSLRDYERNEDTYEAVSSTTYRSSMTPRITNVQRSRPTGLNASGVSTRIYQSYLSTGNDGNFGPGLASLVHFPGVPLRGGSNGVNTAVVSINTARQRDKRDLEHLNDKFAQYVEKVRFLEAHNRKLILEIEALRNRAGQYVIKNKNK
jgi:hypothetical protein